MEKKPVGFWEEEETWDLRRSEYARIVAKTIENANKAGFAEREVKRVRNELMRLKEEEEEENGKWEAAKEKREETIKEVEALRRKAEEVENKREKELKKEIVEIKKKLEAQVRMENQRMRKIIEWKEEITGELNFLHSLVERLTGLDLSKKRTVEKEAVKVSRVRGSETSDKSKLSHVCD